jgi:hypothetical protein
MLLLDSDSRYKKKVYSDENKLRFAIARREANRLKREAINRYSENTVKHIHGLSLGLIVTTLLIICSLKIEDNKSYVYCIMSSMSSNTRKAVENGAVNNELFVN